MAFSLAAGTSGAAVERDVQIPVGGPPFHSFFSACTSGIVRFDISASVTLWVLEVSQSGLAGQQCLGLDHSQHPPAPLTSCSPKNASCPMLVMAQLWERLGP